jgi:hypothetical protein
MYERSPCKADHVNTKGSTQAQNENLCLPHPEQTKLSIGEKTGSTVKKERNYSYQHNHTAHTERNTLFLFLCYLLMTKMNMLLSSL